jgi:O-antigen/teichoic acid export membrane protein
MRIRWLALRRHEFVRPVGVLVGGTALGQGIVALALPVVTRLYSPADFSVAATFVAVLSICGVAACLRFELAIPLPERDDDAANLLAIALASTLLATCAAGLGVVFLRDQAVTWLRQPRLAPFMWLLPLGIALTGTYNALVAWSVRKKDFGAIARTRISQALGVAGIQILFGWLAWTPLGLLVAQVVNSGAGCLNLALRSIRTSSNQLRTISLHRMRSLFLAYRRFPGYSTIEALANAAGMQVPVILIAAAAAGPEAGYLALATTVTQAPLGMIGGAIAQVYLSRAPAEYRTGTLGSFTASMLGGLLKTGVGPLILAGFVAPDVFVFVFGHSWRRSGDLVAWMTPWSVMQFLAVPISMALHVTQNQRAALVLQLSGLGIRAGLVGFAAARAPHLVAEIFAVSGFVFYSIYLGLVLGTAGTSRSAVLQEVRSALPHLVVWATVGLILGQVTRILTHVLG